MTIEFFWWIKPLCLTGFLSALIFVPLVNWLEKNYGWNWALAILTLVAFLPWAVAVLTTVGWLIVNILILIWR